MRLLPTLTCSLLACCGLLASGLAAPPAAAARVSCSEIDLPVSAPTPHETKYGQLCIPAGSAPTTVQLLIPGAAYNRVYWDFPYQPERYSYQRDMARHGHATFAVDRLGQIRLLSHPSQTVDHFAVQAEEVRDDSGPCERRYIPELGGHGRLAGGVDMWICWSGQKSLGIPGRETIELCPRSSISPSLSSGI